MINKALAIAAALAAPLQNVARPTTAPPPKYPWPMQKRINRNRARNKQAAISRKRNRQ